MDDGHERRIEAYLLGEADAAETEALFRWVGASRENARRFARAAALHSELRRALRGAASLGGEVVARAVHGESPPVGLDQEPGREPTAPRREWPLEHLGTATRIAAALLITVAVWFVAGPGAGARDEPFATVVRSSGQGSARSGVSLVAGLRLGEDALELRTGWVDLRLDDGVELTLEAPALLALEAPGRSRLERGLLAASVPEGGSPYAVATPHGHRLESAGSFTVRAVPGGEVLLSAVDGEVRLVGGKAPSGAGRTVTAGRAVRLVAGGGVVDAAGDTGPSDAAWSSHLGIVETAGDVRVASPRGRRRPGRGRDGTIRVVREGPPRAAGRAFAVDLGEPGTYARADQPGRVDIAAGRRFRSFLLQHGGLPAAGLLGPRREGRPGARGRNGARHVVEAVEGKITFARPIVGVAVRDETLARTDGARTPRLRGARRRGLEFGGGREWIRLSPDRRTLELRLEAGPRDLDQVRVFVDAGAPRSGR